MHLFSLTSLATGRAIPRLMLAACCVVLAACSGGGSHPPAVDRIAAVQAAIPSMERARAALSASLNSALSAAAAVDERDVDGAAGNRSAMRTHALAKPVNPTRIDLVVQSTTSAAASYAAAVEVLAGAAERAVLTDPQRGALDGVVAAARAESSTSAELAAVLTATWPAYGALVKQQAKWLTRARAGWYRNTKEAADAYAVLTSAARPAVTTARPKLEGAAGVRAQATAVYAQAVASYRLAVADLP